MRFRTKLMLAFSSLLILLGISFAWVVLVPYKTTLIEGAKDRRGTIVKHISNHIHDMVIAEDALKLKNKISAFCNDFLYVDYIFVVGNNGLLLAHTFEQEFPAGLFNANPLPATRMSNTRLIQTDKGRTRDFAIRTAKNMQAEIHVGINEEHFYKEIKDALKMLAAIFSGCLALGMLVAYFLSYRLSSPLSALSSGMEKIGKGDLKFRLEEKGEHEILNLIQGYNRMAALIKEQTIRQKLGEKTLRYSEEKLAGIIAALQDRISIIDEQYNIVWANEVAKSLFGSDLIGKKCYKAYHESEMPCEPCVVRKSFEDGKVHEHETEVIAANGNRMSFCYSASVVARHKDGRPKTILEVSRNITDRKQAEKFLRTERDKFQGIIGALGEGMYIVNHDYIIEFQNDILKDRFGDVIGKKCHKVYMHSDRPCNGCRFNDAIKISKILNLELTALDGRNYDINFSPFIDVDGSIKVLALLKDVTEKKKLQAENIRAGHLASLGELAAGIAHEINNPINGIINYAQILKDQYHEQGQNGRCDEDIPSRIIKEGERIAKIVRNLLSFARERKEEYSPAMVKDILSNALNLVERQIIKDSIKISVDIPSNLPRVKARSQEIQQVFLNILSNARYALNEKFPGSHEDKILEIRGKTVKMKEQTYVRTTFYDRGTGISADIMDKISDPFFSTKPHGKGTGLGLSISHGIIKNHDGKLRFESVEGEYTRVMVDIPVCNGWKFEK
ncbi:MAG: PAS domain-containing protein [Deltaproteobacteria bacterium]|nr:PAS domain-containing protein [Deltaproteobacteria bacterium]MBW2661827.1 PAS domain-containing protein [Deltaproteobacteria bacterium]